MILIGRRHWQGGKQGTSRLGHFVVRTVLLAISVVAVVLIAQYSPASRLRLDVSRNKISTLTENTREVLSQLQKADDARPVTIDAYVGSNIPADFVQTKIRLGESVA